MSNNNVPTITGLSHAYKFHQIFTGHQGNVSDKWEHYLSVYEFALAQFAEKGKPVRLLEIGVQNGGFLEILAKYLPQGSTLVGIDVDPACAQLSLGHDITVQIGDATNHGRVERMLANAHFDVIIDDGSHRSEDVVATFKACFGHLDPGGVYIVEDVHASYFASHGGGFRHAGSSMEWFKGLLDALNADHFEKDAFDHLDQSAFQFFVQLSRQIAWITFFDSMILIEKLGIKKSGPYRRIVTGRDTPVTNLISLLGVGHLPNTLLPPLTAETFNAAAYNAITSARDEVENLRTLLAQKEIEAKEHERALLQKAIRADAAVAEAERARKREVRLEGTAAEAKQAAAAAQAGESAAKAQRDAVLYSTIWRASLPLRRIGMAMPASTRRATRRLLRGGYWLMTLQFTRRMTERRAARTATAPGSEYDRWVREYDTLTDIDRGTIKAHISRLAYKPLISVVMPVYETPEHLLRETISSVRRQLYHNWELCIADDASPSDTVRKVLQAEAAAESRIKWMRRESNGNIAAATNSALTLATGEFVALLDHDDLLAEPALYEIAVELNAHPDANLLFSDEDHIGLDGRRCDPHFKSGWNFDLMLGQNACSHLSVYRRTMLRRLGGLREGFDGSRDYDLALRVAAQSEPQRIRHIPAILYHWRKGSGASFSELRTELCAASGRRAVGDYLRTQAGAGGTAEVLPVPAVGFWNRVRWPMPNPTPRASVIIPTRDRCDLLARCVSGLLHRTDYCDLELMIIDNGSTEPDVLALLERLQSDKRVRILSHPGQFNYSALNNCAVREATGQVLVLVNNDIDVISAEWLREMVSQAMRPDIGAVGAKLLYANDTIQHAGVILGMGSFDDGPGVAGHLGIGAARPDLGYFGSLILARNVPAVTGACMALRRDVFDAVGGLDEVNLPVAFSDIDLCLRIGERGLRVIWTPFAELYHLESASRGSDQTSPEKIARFNNEARYMRERWGNLLDSDLYFNPNLALHSVLGMPAFPPRRRKPWMSSSCHSFRAELSARRA